MWLAISVCRAGKKLWLWRRFWEDCQKHSLAVTHCAAVYRGKLAEDSPRSAALPGLPSPAPSLPSSAADRQAPRQAGVSTQVANMGGSRAGGIKQGQVGQEVLRAAGEMFIQSHPTHLWFPEGETWPPRAALSMGPAPAHMQQGRPLLRAWLAQRGGDRDGRGHGFVGSEQPLQWCRGFSGPRGKVEGLS